MSLVNYARVGDGLSVETLVDASAPAYPCPACGKETKEHEDAERGVCATRICSAERCRTVTPAGAFLTLS